MQNKEYMVCVKCLTYNHAPYIEDAMNGFCIQETSFPFVCVIIDDASMDGEQEVIKNYLEHHFDLSDKHAICMEETEDYSLTFARHKSNANCFFAVYLLKYNHYQIKKSKNAYFNEWSNCVQYYANCEGDDYWISPCKLQKQVDFLERHPEHSLCIHAYRRDEYGGGGIISREVHKYSGDVEIIPDKDVLNGTGMFGATASMVYRSSAVKDYPNWTKKSPVGDRPLKLVLFARGHIAYIDEVMSVYRVGVPGSWTVRVNRNRKAEKETRAGFVQLLVDFDEWTNKKYHLLVKRAIRDNKKACLKKDILFVLLRPYEVLKKTYRKKLS